MFTKPKHDPKVRFQNRMFRQQLQNARSYKRTAPKLAENKREVFLNKCGLGSWQSKVYAAITLILVIYLLYVPNIFYIKHINITGLRTDQQAQLNGEIGKYLGARSLWPQKNLLLLSKPRLSKFLLDNRKDIYNITSIKKDFPDSINLELEPRTDKYLLEIQGKSFTVSNDGLATAEIPSSTPQNNLIKIKISDSGLPEIGNKYFDDSLLAAINQLNRELPKTLNSPINYFALSKPDSPDMHIYSQAGLKLIFDVKLDVADTINRLNLLFSNLSESDRTRLYYVDMRFANRGYVCFKNTPCTRDTIIKNTITTETATTSPTSTPIQ